MENEQMISLLKDIKKCLLSIDGQLTCIKEECQAIRYTIEEQGGCVLENFSEMENKLEEIANGIVLLNIES